MSGGAYAVCRPMIPGENKLGLYRQCGDARKLVERGKARAPPHCGLTCTGWSGWMRRANNSATGPQIL